MHITITQEEPQAFRSDLQHILHHELRFPLPGRAVQTLRDKALAAEMWLGRSNAGQREVWKQGERDEDRLRKGQGITGWVTCSEVTFKKVPMVRDGLRSPSWSDCSHSTLLTLVHTAPNPFPDNTAISRDSSLDAAFPKPAPRTTTPFIARNLRHIFPFDLPSHQRRITARSIKFEHPSTGLKRRCKEIEDSHWGPAAKKQRAWAREDERLRLKAVPRGGWMRKSKELKLPLLPEKSAWTPSWTDAFKHTIRNTEGPDPSTVSSYTPLGVPFRAIDSSPVMSDFILAPIVPYPTTKAPHTANTTTLIRSSLRKLLSLKTADFGPVPGRARKTWVNEHVVFERRVDKSKGNVTAPGLRDAVLKRFETSFQVRELQALRQGGSMSMGEKDIAMKVDGANKPGACELEESQALRPHAVTVEPADVLPARPIVLNSTLFHHRRLLAELQRHNMLAIDCPAGPSSPDITLSATHGLTIDPLLSFTPSRVLSLLRHTTSLTAILEHYPRKRTHSTHQHALSPPVLKAYYKALKFSRSHHVHVLLSSSVEETGYYIWRMALVETVPEILQKTVEDVGDEDQAWALSERQLLLCRYMNPVQAMQSIS